MIGKICINIEPLRLQHKDKVEKYMKLFNKMQECYIVL